jgi:hypothetical protein
LLGFDTDNSDDREIPCGLGRVVKEQSLPHAGVALKNDDPTSASPGRVEQLIEAGTFVYPVQ